MCFHNKKLTFFCLMIVTSCCLTGCNDLYKGSSLNMSNKIDSKTNASVSFVPDSSDSSPDTSSHKNISKNQSFSDSVEKSSSVFTEGVTSKQLAENYDNFKQTVDAIQADKINKIIVVEYIQGRGTAYSLENEQIIKQWISLIKKLRFSSKPFVSAAGLGYEINVYEGGKKYYLGTWLDKWIYNITNNDTIIYIENYDELIPEIEQLKKDTKACGKIVELP